jgi:uncharacterized protein
MSPRWYDGQPDEVPNAVIMPLVVTREAISVDVAYLVTKLLFDHLDLLSRPIRQPRISMSPTRLSICWSHCNPSAEGHYREIGLMK